MRSGSFIHGGFGGWYVIGPIGRPPSCRALSWSLGRCGTEELKTLENDRGVRCTTWAKGANAIFQYRLRGVGGRAMARRCGECKGNEAARARRAHLEAVVTDVQAPHDVGVLAVSPSGGSPYFSHGYLFIGSITDERTPGPRKDCGEAHARITHGRSRSVEPRTMWRRPVVSQALRAPLASRLLPARLSVAGAPRRTFFGGAFESDFEEARARRGLARSQKLTLRASSFLAALEQLPVRRQRAVRASGAAWMRLSAGRCRSARPTAALARAMSSSPPSRPRARSGRRLQVLPSVKLELPPTEDEAKEAAATTAAAAVGGDESSLDKSMALPHRSEPAADAAALTPPRPASRSGEVHTDPLPGDDPEDRPADVLSEEQKLTLISMRSAAALEGLPRLWDELVAAAAAASPPPPSGDAADASLQPAAPPPLPLPAVLDAAIALCAADAHGRAQSTTCASQPARQQRAWSRPRRRRRGGGRVLRLDARPPRRQWHAVRRRASAPRRPPQGGQTAQRRRSRRRSGDGR